MPGTLVTLVLYVIALCIVVTNFYLRFQARQRKASAKSSLVFLNALLRGLRRQAVTAERKDNGVFGALIVRFEAAEENARAAMNGGSYSAVDEIVDGVERELAVFRQGERSSEKTGCGQPSACFSRK